MLSYIYGVLFVVVVAVSVNMFDSFGSLFLDTFPILSVHYAQLYFERCGCSWGVSVLRIGRWLVRAC